MREVAMCLPLALGVGRVAQADCTCNPGTLQNAFSSAKVVFEGMNVGGDAVPARFYVARTWKGSVAGDVTIAPLDERVVHECGFHFEKGTNYLLFAGRDAEGKLVSDPCVSPRKNSPRGRLAVEFLQRGKPAALASLDDAARLRIAAYGTFLEQPIEENVFINCLGLLPSPERPEDDVPSVLGAFEWDEQLVVPESTCRRLGPPQQVRGTRRVLIEYVKQEDVSHAVVGVMVVPGDRPRWMDREMARRWVIKLVKEGDDWVIRSKDWVVPPKKDDERKDKPGSGAGQPR